MKRLIELFSKLPSGTTLHKNGVHWEVWNQDLEVDKVKHIELREALMGFLEIVNYQSRKK